MNSNPPPSVQNFKRKQCSNRGSEALAQNFVVNFVVILCRSLAACRVLRRDISLIHCMTQCELEPMSRVSRTMRSLLHTSLFLVTILDCSAAEGAYPPSPVIRGIQWAPTNTIIRLANGSDNWPMTWADDDALYTAYGDGNGFEPQLKEKLSLGLAKVLGHPRDIRGINLRSP